MSNHGDWLDAPLGPNMTRRDWHRFLAGAVGGMVRATLDATIINGSSGLPHPKGLLSSGVEEPEWEGSHGGRATQA